MIPPDHTQDAGTEDLPSRKQERGHTPKDEGLALVILWSADEPHRVGETALINGRGVGVFGRGDQDPPRGYRLSLVRQVPGRNLQQPPLRCRRISREQLRISRMRGERLSVENVGRCPLWVHGQPVSQAVVEPGVTLELEGQLLLYCVSRPEILPGAATPLERLHGLGDPDRCEIVGESPAIWKLREVIGFVAPRSGHALILGPSGAGKELIARATHALSPRADRPMICRNAATIPHTLVDAELFGHARDYPNAGMPARPGLVGEAEGSTLFLDEIGELPTELQAHLLRLMDRGEYQRLGESRPRVADVRIIGATNRSSQQLKQDFAARFRHVITAPSLDERREDIPLLVCHLLRRAAQEDPTLAERFFERGEDGRAHPRISVELIDTLMRHPLPLQVRQLDNLLWQALAESPDSRVEVGAAIRDQAQPVEDPAAETTSHEDLTPEQIQACLDKHGGVQARVWRELGLPNRYVLRRLVAKYDLRIGDGDGG